jgi:hypothetical protein
MTEFQHFSEAVGWVADWAAGTLPEIISSIDSAKTSGEASALTALNAAEAALSAKNEAENLISQYMANPSGISDADLHSAGEVFAENWSNLPTGVSGGYIKTASGQGDNRYQQLVAADGAFYVRVCSSGVWGAWKQAVQQWS